MTKTHPNQSRGILISLTILKKTCLFCSLSLHQGTTDSHKNLEQRFIFQISTLNPPWHPWTLFIQLIYSCFSRDQVPTNSVAPSSVYKAYTTHNSSNLLWWRANARNVSLSISVRWSLYIINSIDIPKITKIFMFHSPPTQHYSFFRN